MGNIVEDRQDTDEIARAAYALDRATPGEIVNVISSDKRADVARLLTAAQPTQYISLIDPPSQINLDDVHFIRSVEDELYECPSQMTIVFNRAGGMNFSQDSVFDLKEFFRNAVVNIGQDFEPSAQRERHTGVIVPRSHILGIGSRYTSFMDEFYLITRDQPIRIHVETAVIDNRLSDIINLCRENGIPNIMEALGERSVRDPKFEIIFPA